MVGQKRRQAVLIATGILSGLAVGWFIRKAASRLVEGSAGVPAWLVCPLTAVLWAAIAATAPSPAAAAYGWVVAALAVLITITDVLRRTIPNVALAAATVLWVPLWLIARPGPLAAGPFGALVFAGPLWAAARLRPGEMGMGDVKLGAVLGLYLGFPLSVVGLILGVLAGGLGGAAVLLRASGSRRDTIPYGPFLAAGALAALVWGSRLLHLLGPV